MNSQSFIPALHRPIRLLWPYFGSVISELRHSRTWPGSVAFWRFLLAFVSLIKPYLHLFPVYRGTGRTCAFLARGQLPQAICSLSVTWFDSTQTPRTANPQESVKKRVKENAEPGMNQDSSVLVQSAHGCHGNRISLSFHLAPPTDLLAASGDQGNLQRTASVLSSAWLYFYTTEFYTLLSLDHKVEMKNLKNKTHIVFLTTVFHWSNAMRPFPVSSSWSFPFPLPCGLSLSPLTHANTHPHHSSACWWHFWRNILIREILNLQKWDPKHLGDL